MVRADAVANRMRIIEAAKLVFAEQGFEAEMKEIAARADLGVGTIYRNFPTKTDLIVALMLSAQEEALDAMNAAEGAPDAIDGLRDAFHAFLRVSKRYGWVMEAWLSGQGIDPVAIRKAGLARDTGDRTQVLERLLRRGVAEGTLRSDLDVDLTLRVLFGSAFPLLHGPMKLDRSLQEIGDAALTLFLDGARVRP